MSWEDFKNRKYFIVPVDNKAPDAPPYRWFYEDREQDTRGWISRIKPTPLRGKWALLLSSSSGMVGGIRGLWQLRIPLEGLGTFVHPDMYALPLGGQAFDEAGALKDAAPRERLEKIVAGYLDALRKARA